AEHLLQRTAGQSLGGRPERLPLGGVRPQSRHSRGSAKGERRDCKQLWMRVCLKKKRRGGVPLSFFIFVKLTRYRSKEVRLQESLELLVVGLEVDLQLVAVGIHG